MLMFSLDTNPHLVIVSYMCSRYAQQWPATSRLDHSDLFIRASRYLIVGIDSITSILACLALISIELCSHHAGNMRLLQIGFVPQTSRSDLAFCLSRVGVHM
jgi:hypothetical protein